MRMRHIFIRILIGKHNSLPLWPNQPSCPSTKELRVCGLLQNGPWRALL